MKIPFQLIIMIASSLSAGDFCPESDARPLSHAANVNAINLQIVRFTDTGIELPRYPKEQVCAKVHYRRNSRAMAGNRSTGAASRGGAKSQRLE